MWVPRPPGANKRPPEAPSMLLVALLLFSTLGAGAQPTGGCGRSAGRRLLQQAPSGNSTGPIIETVEVDVVSQECVILLNSYYDTYADGIKVLDTPFDNKQPSARACCASCHDLNSCNAWQWCALEGGCQLQNTSVTFPYQGCQLIDLSGFLLGSVNTGQIKQSGPSVPFTAGSPLFFSVPKLSGYDVEIGRNFGGKFNYSCPSTLEKGACVLEGTAESLRVACNADQHCLAFSFYPKGGVFDPNMSYGVLKGGQGVRLSNADTELNPNAAIYIKLQPVGGDGDNSTSSGGGSSSGGDSDNNTVIAAVVSTVVGTAAVVTAVLLVVYVRFRRLKAAVADERKPESDGGADSGGEDGQGGGSSGGGGSPLAADTDAAAVAVGGLVLGQAHAPESGGRQSTSSDTSQEDQLLAAMAEQAGYPVHKLMRRTGSSPSVVEAAHGVQAAHNGSGSPLPGPPGSGNGYSPFMMLSPQQLAAVSVTGRGSLPPSVVDVVVDVSRSSSGGSAAAWQQSHGLGLEVGQQPAAHQHIAGQQQLESDVVVEVQRAVPGYPAGGGMPTGPTSTDRGSLPPSMQMAGTARELLEVFARMYSQRPAVDYAVVAQMLDQDADPGAVAAAEQADEEHLRQVDWAATQQRAASRSASGSESSSSGQLHAGVYHQHLQHHVPHPQQHTLGPVAEGAPSPPYSGSSVEAAVGGAAEAQQQPQPPEQQQQQQAELLPQQSLLPGMSNPESSMVPQGLAPQAEWSLQPEEVEICKRPDGTYWQLGTGAFGTCYKGLYHSKQLVAVKVLHRMEERRRGEEFEREVALLKNLRDRNIVQFIGACLDGPAPMLVTEFMEFGDLWRALPLKNPAGQRIFSWAKRGRRVLYDVAKGLCYLHRRRIVHLDLKSANILLSRHGTAKICDIGMARVLGNKEYLSMLSGMGTFAWSAPEVLSGRRCTEKVDLYSFGVVIWEVCTGDVPVRGEMRPLVAPADCPQPVVDLYNACVSEFPDQRPTALEVMQLLGSLL